MTDFQKALYTKFKAAKNDVGRWRLLEDASDVTIYLDNDDTFAMFDDDTENEFIMYFDQYIGRDAFYLLEAFGLKAEAV